MGRQKIEVDKDKFTETVKDLDSSKNFLNRSQLYTAVAEKLGCPSSIVPLRITEWQIPIVTPLGRRGKLPGQAPNTIKINQNGLLKKRDRLQNPQAQKSVKLIKKITPERFQNVAARFHKSLKAAVRLKCLECSDYQPKEIAACPCKDCPIWLHRPYAKWIANQEEMSDGI